MGILIVTLSLLAVARAELVITATPEVVSPGLTPSFSVNCELVEMEEVKIVTLTISRQTYRRDGSLRPKKEVIAKIDALTPQAALGSLKYPQVTVLGTITSIESELGSYLTAVWPNPRFDDLGLYTCDATVVGEFGVLEPLTAAIQITSANPVVDRVLVALFALEAKLDGFNQTLASFQAQLDNVKAEAQLREAALLEQLATTTAPPPTTTTTAAQTTPTITTSAGETTTPAKTTAAKTTAGLETTTATPTVSVIDQLISALEIITVRLEAVNASVTVLEEKVTAYEAINVTVTSLEEKVIVLEAFDASVAVLEEKLVAFEAVNVSVNVIEEKLVALETVNTSVTALEGKVTALESINASVEVLEEKVAALESPVVENATQVTQTQQLSATVDILVARLEAFNATVVALEQQIAKLVAEELENDTNGETKPADDLRRYFVSANSSYFLIRGKEDADSFKAQAVCESKQLYLAEIGSQEEFNFIEIEVGSYILDDVPVLIGGKRRLGSNEWTWQYSGDVVNYFSWAAGEPVLASIIGDCIALRTVAGLAEMVSVPCYTEKRQFYFLCERDLK